LGRTNIKEKVMGSVIKYWLRLRTIDEDVLRYQLKVGRWIREGKE
jgi:hypothetical protein